VLAVLQDFLTKLIRELRGAKFALQYSPILGMLRV